MGKVVRFFKNVSILLFVVLLVLSYMELSDRSTTLVLYRDADGGHQFRVSVDTYFYASSAIVIFSNFILSMVVMQLQRLPMHRMEMPEVDFWRASPERKERLKDIFRVWIYGFAIMINVVVITCVGKIWFVNRGIGGKLSEYGWILFGFVLAFLLWFGFIFYRVRVRKEEYII